MNQLAAPDRAPRRRRWRGPLSLRGRVVLGVLTLLLALLLLLFTAMDLALASTLRSDLTTRLSDRVALAQQLDGSLSAQQLVDKLRGQGVEVRLCAQGGGCVSAGPSPLAPGSRRPAPSPGASPGAAIARPRGPGAGPKAAAAVRQNGSTLYVRTRLRDGGVLTLSTDGSSVPTTISRLIALEAAAGVAALALAAGLLGRVVGHALRPLDQMTELATKIASGKPALRSQRLRTGRPNTELGRTAQAFDDMLDELEGAIVAANDAERRMRTLLGDVSHELRTPLAALHARLEQVLRTPGGRFEREAALAGALRESVRAARLVEDLLTASRLDHPVALRLVTTDVARLAREEVDRFSLLTPSVHFRFQGKAPVRAEVDPARVAQIVSNLLDNARAVSPPGGAVTTSVDIAHDQVVLMVGDTGPGVAAGDRERIFERLVRLDAARARRTGGAGLGLPIARAFARAHGGDLVCLPGSPGGVSCGGASPGAASPGAASPGGASPGGCGACFRLTLPVHPARG